MKKKIILGALATVVLIGVITYINTYGAYQQNDDFYGFPIPKNAILEKSEDGIGIYKWMKASEENGIPAGYEFIIKSNGWVKGKREGASVIYTKDQREIELISTTDRLTIKSS